MLSVKAEQVASFLGRQITPLLAQEIGSQFTTRIAGTCIKHHFGKCSSRNCPGSRESWMSSARDMVVLGFGGAA